MRVDALIPLKGHSARVPGKNLRPFAGRPLFHVIVHTLQEAETVGHVYIDTDSDDIADSAAGLDGVTVVWRPPELRGDEVSVNLLIGNFLERHPDQRHVLQTHCTNPLLTATTIDDAVRRYFADRAATSLFTVTRIQARLYLEDLTPVNHDPAVLLPTQELPPVFLENSNMYIFERDAFFASGTRRITDRPMLYEMDPLEAVDIDEEHDFRVAELLYESRQAGDR